MKALARACSPVSLALSCVLASIALCLHADNILLFALEKTGAADLFVCAFLGGAAALCLAVAVSAHDDEQRRWSIGVGLASAGAGIVFALLLDALPAPMVSVCSGALLGFGLTCLLRQWGRFYRSFTFQGALLNTGLSFLLSSLWWFAMVHAGTPFLFCLGLIVLVFQAVLLAHGGLTTLGANTFSMAIAGPLVSWGVYALCKKARVNRKLAIFLAASLGDLFTYCVTSLQLAMAYPAAEGGAAASAVRFFGVFAPTQLPLAAIEGILTVLVVMGLES